MIELKKIDLFADECPGCGSKDIEAIYVGKFWTEYKCGNPECPYGNFGVGDNKKEINYRNSLYREFEKSKQLIPVFV